MGMYFSLITFTTIGLGDYAPAFGSDRTAVEQFIGYFGFGLGTMVGLSLLTTVLAGVQDALQDYQDKLAAKLKAAGGSKGSSGDAAPRKRGGILAIMGGGAIDMGDDEQIEKDNAEAAIKLKAQEKVEEKKKKKKKKKEKEKEICR